MGHGLKTTDLPHFLHFTAGQMECKREKQGFSRTCWTGAPGLVFAALGLWMVIAQTWALQWREIWTPWGGASPVLAPLCLAVGLTDR